MTTALHATTDTITADIAAGGLVAVLRAPEADMFAAIAEVLVEAGITTLEITLTSRGAVAALADLRREFAESAIVGAGTILTSDDADAAVQAGAQFLVSPIFDPLLVQGSSVPFYPGAYTPTEVHVAVRAGAPLIKLFPGGGLGSGYLRDLRGPLPEVAIMPTGGIDIDDIGEWLAAGAVAVGLGGPLLGDAVIGGSLAALAGRARRALDAVSEARS